MTAGQMAPEIQSPNSFSTLLFDGKEQHVDFLSTFCGNDVELRSVTATMLISTVR